MKKLFLKLILPTLSMISCYIQADNSAKTPEPTTEEASIITSNINLKNTKDISSEASESVSKPVLYESATKGSHISLSEPNAIENITDKENTEYQIITEDKATEETKSVAKSETKPVAEPETKSTVKLNTEPNIQNSRESIVTEEITTASIPSFNNYNEMLQKVKSLLEEVKQLTTKLKEREDSIIALKDQINILTDENKDQVAQVKDLMVKLAKRDNELSSLKEKFLNVNHNNEELLSLLFTYQSNVKEVKDLSFRLTSVLNQIPIEDEITKDCIKFLQDISDLNVKVDQILQSAENATVSDDDVRSLLKELDTMKKLTETKLEFYQTHKDLLIKTHNEDVGKLPTIEQMQNAIKSWQEQYGKKFKELAHLDLEHDLMNTVNTIKVYRQKQSNQDAINIKDLEKLLYDYIYVKIQRSNLSLLYNQITTFAENISKIQNIQHELLLNENETISKYNKLSKLVSSNLKLIEEESVANDNDPTNSES